MKVCLIAPCRPYLINQKALVPLGLLYVADALKKQKQDVEVLDFADGYQFIEADLYGVGVTTPDYAESLKILKWLKENGAKRVVCGGPHASLCPEQCLKDGFDGVSVGDGELTIEGLLKGEKRVEAWAQDVNDFYPDRHAIDLWKYEFDVGGKRATSLITARGCSWQGCAFCSRWDKGIRFCSAEHVDKEIADIRDLGFKSVAIYDDEFFLFPSRDLQIIKMLGDADLEWRAFAHSHFLLRNKDMVREASGNGLVEVLIGIESGSRYILESINKGTTPGENMQAIRLLQDHGVRVKGAFIVGLPGESWKSVKETEDFIQSCPCDDYDFSILQVYPGSDILKNPDVYDLKFHASSDPWKGIPGNYKCDVYTSNLSSRELIEIREDFEKRYKKW